MLTFAIEIAQCRVSKWSECERYTLFTVMQLDCFKSNHMPFTYTEKPFFSSNSLVRNRNGQQIRKRKKKGQNYSGVLLDHAHALHNCTSSLIVYIHSIYLLFATRFSSNFQLPIDKMIWYSHSNWFFVQINT